MRFRPDPVQKAVLVPFLAGGLAVFIGERASMGAVTGCGAILIAIAPAAIGLHTLAKGRIALRIDRYGEYEEVYEGIGARLWGLLFILGGAAVAVFGISKLGGFEGPIASALDRWPGLAVAAVGTGLGLYGTAQASGARILRHGKTHPVSIVPERIGGAMTAILGLTFAAAGLLHAAAPAAFDSLTKRLGRVLLTVAERWAS